MSIKVIKKEDLSFLADAAGYTVFYKKTLVVFSAGTIANPKRMHYKLRAANRKMYSEHAKSHIENILNGKDTKAIEAISRSKVQ